LREYSYLHTYSYARFWSRWFCMTSRMLSPPCEYHCTLTYTCELYFFCTRHCTHRGLHGEEGYNLEQVVLHDVTDDAISANTYRSVQNPQ